MQFTTVPADCKEESETAPDREFYVAGGFSQEVGPIPYSDRFIESLGILTLLRRGIYRFCREFSKIARG